jgi:hypothetical protein
MFFLLLSMWPMMVASAGGGYFSKLASVRPVNGGRKPLFSACSKVEVAGENRATGKNAIKSAGYRTVEYSGLSLPVQLPAGLRVWELGGQMQAKGGTTSH